MRQHIFRVPRTNPQATPVVVGHGTEHAEIEWVVNSRLREGSIEVTLDSHGQPQKEMGVCVTMFDADNRNTGGVGYERRSEEPVVVKVVEGVQIPLGGLGADIIRALRSPKSSTSSALPGVRSSSSPWHRCLKKPWGRDALRLHRTKPFSPSRVRPDVALVCSRAALHVPSLRRHLVW